MDSNGRLHMPGFVGETFEETGALKPTSVGMIMHQTMGALKAGEIARALALLEEEAKRHPPEIYGEQEKGISFDEAVRPSSDELIREHMSRNQRRVMDSKVAARHQGKLMKSRP